MRAVREYLPALGVFVLGIALWEAFVFAFAIEFYLLPAPHVIVATLRQSYPVLLDAGLYTSGEALAGYGLGCGLGVLAAMVASRSPAFAGLVLPYAIASAPVPIVALAPLAIVWFGIGPGSKIAIVTLMTFFPTFIGTLRGLLSVDPQSLELMESYAATEWQIFLKLRLPHSVPLMFTAFRACTTLAMIGAVVSEFFGGPVKSLGVYIKSTASLFQTRQAWSAILVACALGLAFYLAVALVEDGIFVRADWLRAGKNKEVAARFLRASLKGWEFCRDNAAACVDLVLKESPVLGKEHQTWMMTEINKLVWGPPAPKTPVGKMDPEAFKRTADIALKFGVIKKPADPAAYTHEVWELARTLR